MINVLVDAIGWLGAALVVVAYAMVSFQKMQSSSVHYQLLNMVGSGCLILNTVYHHAFPSAFVNVIWIMIAIASFLRPRREPEGSSGVSTKADN